MRRLLLHLLCLEIRHRGEQTGGFPSLLLSQFLVLITGQLVNWWVRRVQQILRLVYHSSVRSVLWLLTLSCFSNTLPFSNEQEEKRGLLVVVRILCWEFFAMVWDSMVSPWEHSCEKSPNMPTTWALLALSSMHAHLMEALCLDARLNWHFLPYKRMHFSLWCLYRTYAL